MSGLVNPLRAGIYGRESKDKAKSVDDQLDIGLDAIREHGWTHVESYDDGSSASRFATRPRKHWERLIANLADGKLDVLIVWEITRGSREPVDGFTWLNLCRDHGTLIHVVNDERTYDPRKARDYKDLGNALVDGAYESDRTSERVTRGVRRSAMAGNPAGGQVPRGYLRERSMEHDEAGKLRPVVSQRIEPDGAALVRDVFERVAKHDPISVVSRDTGLRTQSIRKMVRNRAYLGQRVYDTAVVKGSWPGIISARLFTAANAVLDEPGRRRDKPGRKKWLLSYIAVSACGGRIMATLPTSKGQLRAVYKCLPNGCVNLGVAEADEYILRLVAARLSRDDAVDLFLADDTAAAQAETEAADLVRRLDEWRAAAVKGEVTPATMHQIETELGEQIADAERRRIAAAVPAVIADIVTSDTPRKTLDDLPLAGKRVVIATLFSEIRITRPSEPRRITRWSTFDDRLEHAAARIEIEWRQP